MRRDRSRLFRALSKLVKTYNSLPASAQKFPVIDFTSENDDDDEPIIDFQVSAGSLANVLRVANGAW